MRCEWEIVLGKISAKIDVLRDDADDALAMPRLVSTSAACVALAVVTPFLAYLPMPAQHYAGKTVAEISIAQAANLPTFPADLSGFGSVVADRLQNATRILEGKVLGIETVAVGPDGDLHMLDRFGKLQTARVAADGAVALNDAARHIGVAGRPLGFTFDAVGRMLICDPVAGLLRYTAPGSGQPRAVTEVLSNGLADGASIRYANDVAVARDGTIYFTASSDQAVGFGAAAVTAAVLMFICGAFCGPRQKKSKWLKEPAETAAAEAQPGAIEPAEPVPEEPQ